jgi:hypothetical protein
MRDLILQLSKSSIYSTKPRSSRCCGTPHHCLRCGCDGEGAAGREQINQALAADNLHPITGEANSFEAAPVFPVWQNKP